MEFIEDSSTLDRLSKKAEEKKVAYKGLVRIFRVFGRHCRKYWKVLSVAYLSLFATIGLTVLTPWPLKLILDHVILEVPLPEPVAFLNPLFAGRPALLLLLLSLSIVLIALLAAAFSYINKFWVSSTGDRIVADIRERAFAHLQELSLSFHETARSGNLVYLMTSDVKEIKKILIDFPHDISQRLLTFAAYAVLMLALDWRLGLIALSSAPLVYFMTRYFGSGLRKAMTKKREQEGEVASIVAENMTAMALVQAYGREETERIRFSLESQESLKAQLRALRLQKTYSRITDFLVTLSTAGVLYWGGRYTLAGNILPGTLVVFVAYMRDIYNSLEKFSELFINLAKSQVACQRLLELVENEMIIKDKPAAAPAPRFRGHIEFKNVGFAYKKGVNVLSNLSFVVEPGETVALVGHSGAGKSTLIGLLLRFYDPQEGEILIDGQDIRKFTIKSLRKQMTILLQDAKLFCQTVRENLAFGKVDATEEEIIQSARLAEAHGFIMEMPAGYDTMMYEGGDNLSGGQKQRINIGRAFIRNTPILILDEPASGLDVKIEAKINAAIRRLTRGRTTFIIAHKFSTIASADKILLLEEGQLALQGTHRQLLRESPQYRELHELQSGRPWVVEGNGNQGNGRIEVGVMKS